ncbi:MAG: hypothetical protein ACFFG0_01540 [Candidatus Thorarchaeota archaeon]
MTDEKVKNIRGYSKMEELNKWLKDLIFPGDVKNFILELENHSIPGVEVARKVCFYTEEHQYFITAIDRTKDDGYLGCQVNCRKARAGEDWIRGNDLPDGKFTKATWDRIILAIINYELVRLSNYTKPQTGDLDDGNGTREK